MPLIWGAAIAGVAGIAGDVMSSNQAQQTNDTSVQIANMNNLAAENNQLSAQGFNASQADLSRQFAAGQQANQQQFNSAMMVQAENYDTQMANTQMQRRVADLQAAGINPLLAVSQGGAAAPTISPASSGIATSAAQASAPGLPQRYQPNLINPGQAWGSLGAQISNAADVQKNMATVDLIKAQTDKTNAETDTQLPAQADYLKSMTGLNDQSATQAYYNTQLLQEKIYGQRLDNDQLRDITIPIGQQNLAVIKGTRDALISAQNSEATAKQLGLQGLSNLNQVQQGNFGLILTYLNSLLGPASSALSIYNRAQYPTQGR